MRYIATFKSAREAIKGDKLCAKQGIQATIIPVPTHISSECGMCLRLETEQVDIVKTLMQENKINIIIYDDK